MRVTTSAMAASIHVQFPLLCSSPSVDLIYLNDGTGHVSLTPIAGPVTTVSPVLSQTGVDLSRFKWGGDFNGDSISDLMLVANGGR